MNNRESMRHFDKAMKKADYLLWFLCGSMIAPPIILITIELMKRS